METEAENQLVKLGDIITIRPGSGNPTESQSASHSKSTRSNIELLPVGVATSFTIYHVVRASGYKLRQSRIVFCASDSATVTQWVDRVTDILAGPGNDKHCTNGPWNLYGRDGKFHATFNNGMEKHQFSVPLLMT